MTKMLMLGTSNGSREMLRYAKSQGIYTIVTDYLDPDHSIAKKMADEYWMINTTDIDALAEKCKQENVTAVITGVSEFNLERSLELCTKTGMRCYCSPESWHYSKDKQDFKRLCKKLGVPVPTDYSISEKLTDEELDRIKYPVVLKPVDLSSNRGISYCYNKQDVIKAYHLARSMSKNPNIIVERMLHGEEWFASYALAKGEISLLALNAMYAQPGEPANCYTITTTVSDNVERFVNEVNPQIEKLLKEIGCKEGFVWVQAMLDEDGHFYIIEMGYRLEGAMIFIPYKDVCNFDVIKWMVDYACGRECLPSQLPPGQKKAYKKCGCAMMLWANKSGVATRVEGIEEVSKIPGVIVDVRTKVGDQISQYRPYGNILFTTENCDEMCNIIDIVNKKIRIIDENGTDMIIKYTNFDYLKKVYHDGLEGK